MKHIIIALAVPAAALTLAAPSLAAQAYMDGLGNVGPGWSTITMPDGSRGQHMGFYAHVIDAVVRAMDYFPDARRISGRPA